MAGALWESVLTGNTLEIGWSILLANPRTPVVIGVVFDARASIQRVGRQNTRDKAIFHAEFRSYDGDATVGRVATLNEDTKERSGCVSRG